MNAAYYIIDTMLPLINRVTEGFSYDMYTGYIQGICNVLLYIEIFESILRRFLQL